MTETIQPVSVSVSVGVDQKRAFEVFADEMTSWWPAGHHIGEAPIQQVVVEPFVGGRWYTKHTDGSETETGVVTAYDAPLSLSTCRSSSSLSRKSTGVVAPPARQTAL